MLELMKKYLEKDEKATVGEFALYLRSIGVKK